MRPSHAQATLALAAAGITLGACTSAPPPTTPPTGCTALAACCGDSTVPPSAAATCNGVLGDGNDETCDEYFSQYVIMGYCGDGGVQFNDGGTSSLGQDCGALLACCSMADFTGDMGDCTTTIYGGSESACASLLSSYVTTGKCEGPADAGTD